MRSPVTIDGGPERITRCRPSSQGEQIRLRSAWTSMRNHPLAGRPFTSFALDVGQGDALSGEAEWKHGQADLAFAGIERPRLPVYPLANHFAEKLHTYTRPRERRTRVKDLLDLALILEDLRDDLPSAGTMRRTIEATFDRYGTHVLPAPLPAPPEDWARPFEAEAQKLPTSRMLTKPSKITCVP